MLSTAPASRSFTYTHVQSHTQAKKQRGREREMASKGGRGGVGEREGTLARTALALLVALSRLRQVRCQLQQRPAALRECRSPTSGGAKATPAPIVGWRSWRIGAVGLQARSPTVAVPFASIWQIQLPILNISTEPNQSAKTGTCCQAGSQVSAGLSTVRRPAGAIRM